MTDNIGYKVGYEIIARYEPNDPRRYKLGQKVDTFDKDGNRVATFEVFETDNEKVKGKIINTYGHRRRKH